MTIPGFNRRDLLKLTASSASAALVGAPNAVDAIPPSGSDQEVVERIDASFASIRPTDPGLSLGVLRGGEVIALRSYGLANLEWGSSNSAATRFHCASVSKQFTAIAMLQIIAAGKLELDTDIREVLPWIPNFGVKLTTRHLLHHTSGLRDQWSLFLYGGRQITDALSLRQIINMITRQRALNFNPGAEFAYCNTGYTLIALMVEQLSGKRFAAYTDEAIFTPLGMADTCVLDDLELFVSRRADSYHRISGRWKRFPLNFSCPGATGLLSTPSDLLRWQKVLLRPTGAWASIVAQAIAPSSLNDGSPLSYGFGLQTAMFDGREAIGHSGADAGFRAHCVCLPKEDLAVVVLRNDQGNAPDAAARVITAVLGALPKPPRAATMPAPEPAKLVGSWFNPNRQLLTIANDGGGLVGTTAASGVRSLTLHDDGSFDFGVARSVRFALTADDELLEVPVDVLGPGAPIAYRRATPATPSLADLKKLTGIYRCDELDLTYELSVEDGVLSMRSIWSVEPIRWTPSVKGRFDTSFGPFGSLEVMAGRSGVASMTFDSPRARHVALRRSFDRQFPTLRSALRPVLRRKRRGGGCSEE